MRGIYQLRFSPDGRTLATRGAAQEILVWNWPTRNLRFTLKRHEHFVRDLQFIQDGKFLVSITDQPGDAAIVWNMETGAAEYEIEQHGQLLTELPEGAIGIFSDQQLHRFWVPPDRAHESELLSRDRELQPITAVPEASRVVYFTTLTNHVFGGPNRFQVQVVDRVTKRTSRFDGATGMPQAAVIFRGAVGEQAVICCRRDDRLFWIRTDQGGLPTKGNAHAGAISDISVSPDGRWLATASWDQTIKIWETCSGEPLLQLTGHNDKVLSVDFSHQGRYLASGGAAQDNSVIVWDLSALLLDTTTVAGAEPLEQHWDRLLSTTPATAYASLSWLKEHPEQTLELLERKYLSQADAVPIADFERWLHGLASDSFDERNRAYQKLFDRRELLTPRLQTALRDAPALEVRLQLDRILNAKYEAEKISNDSLRRTFRAIFLLELLNDSRSVALIDWLANHGQNDQIKTHAADVLARCQPQPGT